MRFLLGRRADPNAADAESGWTALHRALYAGHLRIALLLLRAGAVLGDELTPWRGGAGGGGNAARPQLQQHHGHGSSAKNAAGADHDGLTPLALASWLRRGQLRQARAEGRGGDVVSFGKGLDNQLGYPASDKHGRRGDDVPKPRRIEALADVEVVGAAAARYHSVVLSAEGQVWTWGQGRGGRLGHGDEAPQLFPRLVEPLVGVRVVKVAAAENHTACITAEGAVFCWGSDRYGQLGQGGGGGGGGSHQHSAAASPSTGGGAFSASYSLRPRPVLSLKKAPMVDIAAGATHTAAVSFDGRVFCWGGNAHRQLGHEAVGAAGDGQPRMVALLYHRRNEKKDPRRAIQVSAGCTSTLVIVEGPFYGHIKQPSKVFEWGNGSAVPRRVDFRSAEQARYQLLQHRGRGSGGGGGGRRRSNSNAGASLWALGSRGGVDGDGSGTGRINIVQVAAGQTHNVARSSDGGVYVWGLGVDALGGLGGASGHAAHPRAVEGLGADRAVHVSASMNRTCVVTEAGDLWSWGAAREQGVLGHGLHNWMPVPKRVVGLKRAVKVAAGPEHTLCLLSASAPPLPHPHLTPPPAARGVEREEDSDEDRRAGAGSPATAASDAPAELFEMDADDDDDADGGDEGWAAAPQLQEDEGVGSFAGPHVAAALMGQSEHLPTRRDPPAAAGKAAAVPSLKELCERSIAQQVDMRNAISVLAHAEALDAGALADYCVEYVSRNMDGILVAGRPADLDYLLEEAADDVSELLAAGARESGSVEDEEADGASGCGLSGGGGGGPGDGYDGRPSAVAVMLARAQRGQDPELEETLKLERGAKKKLAQCEELQRRLDTAGAAALAPEQVRKLGRRASLEAEIQALQPLLQRLRVVEKARGLREKQQQQQQQEQEAQEATAAAAEVAAAEKKSEAAAAEAERDKAPPSFLCDACGVKSVGGAAWAEHLAGRRHAKRVQRLEEERQRQKEELWPQGTPGPAPNSSSPSLSSPPPWGGLDPATATATPSPQQPRRAQAPGALSAPSSASKKTLLQLMEEEAALSAASAGSGSARKGHASSLSGSHDSSSYYGRSPSGASSPSPFLVGSPSHPLQQPLRWQSLSSSHGSATGGSGFGGRSAHDEREGGGIPLAAFLVGSKGAAITPFKPTPALSSSSCWASKADAEARTASAAAAATAAAAAAAAVASPPRFESIMAEEERKAQQQRFFTGNNCPWYTERRDRSASLDVIQEQQLKEQQVKEEEESRALAEALAVAAAEEEKELLQELERRQRKEEKKQQQPPQQQRRMKAAAGAEGGSGGKKTGGGGGGGGRGNKQQQPPAGAVVPPEGEAPQPLQRSQSQSQSGKSRTPKKIPQSSGAGGGGAGGGGGRGRKASSSGGGGEGRRRSASFSAQGSREKARAPAAAAPVS